MAEQVALEALGLFKRYGDRHAIHGVDLSVRAGEVHGLLGPNGAGKTTLLRMLLGLATPDAGTVRLLGRSAGTAAGPATGGVAGFVETPRFYPYLSGRRNLRLLARLDGLGAGLRREKVDEALDRFALSGDAETLVGAYSAGTRQRLGLAAAWLRSPRLLVLDEPTISLDPAAARHLRSQLRELALGGCAVLLSSHDLVEVAELCTKVTVLDRGQVAFSGSLDDLRGLAPDGAHRLSSSDDARALAIAKEQRDLVVVVAAAAPAGESGLDVSGTQTAVDSFVIALGRAGVAVRALERRHPALESLFLSLTARREPSRTAASGPPRPSASIPDRTTPAEPSMSAGAIWGVVGVECAKLAAQLKVWALLVALLVGPFAFVLATRMQSDLPEDTLFGRWVKASGFAVPLVVLGFSSFWAFPALTSVVGGDLFSSEDRYGTWPTLLTRSRTRGEILAGKLVTAMAFSLVAATLLAASSVAAGILLVGREPLIGLSGTLLPPGRCLSLVALAWASVLPPVLAFTALATLLSAATRSSAAGLGLPVLIGLVMQLYSFVEGPYAIRSVLLTSAFSGWHGLFAEPRFHGPLVQGTAMSVVYLAVCVVVACVLLSRREMGR
jgi:ABC-type multidrug transport system ATPase subunit/ABC-type transport system involved in multi-copper enzyme maturation permease subunit